MHTVIGAIILVVFWAGLAWAFYHLQEPDTDNPVHWYRGRRR